MIYDIEYETMPREALESIQLRRLKATIDRAYANVPFYRKQFETAGITPGDVQSLQDLQRLPFTTKQDLRDNYPFRHVRRSHGKRGSHSCLFRYHRTAPRWWAIRPATWTPGPD